MSRRHWVRSSWKSAMRLRMGMAWVSFAFELLPKQDHHRGSEAALRRSHKQERLSAEDAGVSQRSRGRGALSAPSVSSALSFAYFLSLATSPPPWSTYDSQSLGVPPHAQFASEPVGAGAADQRADGLGRLRLVAAGEQHGEARGGAEIRGDSVLGTETA